jgi:hypothetical protein
MNYGPSPVTPTPAPSVAQTSGGAPGHHATPAPDPIDATLKDFEAVRKGIDRLTSPTAEAHRQLGQGILLMASVVAPRVIAAVRGGLRGWHKPDAESKRRAKALAKTWGV